MGICDKLTNRFLRLKFEISKEYYRIIIDDIEYDLDILISRDDETNIERQMEIDVVLGDGTFLPLVQERLNSKIQTDWLNN